MASCGSRRAGTPSAASACAPVALALLFAAGAGAESKPPRVAAAVDEAVPAFDGRPDADRLADVLAGLVGGPCGRPPALAMWNWQGDCIWDFPGFVIANLAAAGSHVGAANDRNRPRRGCFGVTGSVRMPVFGLADDILCSNAIALVELADLLEEVLPLG